MNSQNILSEKKDIIQKLSKRQIKDAVIKLKVLITQLQNSLLADKISELEQNYKYMLHYQFEGVEDPEQGVVYNNLVRNLYELTDDVVDQLLVIDSSNLFYEKTRINRLRGDNTLAGYKKSLTDLYATLSLIDLQDNEAERAIQQKNILVKAERIIADVFSYIYTSDRADDNTYLLYLDFINSAELKEKDKCLFISALTLNLFHRFDSRKVRVLMDTCLNENMMISQRALVGLIIVLQMYDKRWDLYAECHQQLTALSEDIRFKKSALTVIKQLIRSRETEKISKKLTDEIIPEMMRFNSLAGKKLNMEELMGMTDDFSEKNPEWKQELESSGLADKLQEYSNLQMEGADVFHSTFANLKSFPFFYEFSNWFLPFDTSYSEFSDLFAQTDKNNMLYTAILASGHMCNSDKYSFCLSLLQMPEAQKNMVMHQFNAESEEVKQLQKDALALNPSINEEVISNQYIQDLYRFFKLYISRNSFSDIFKFPINYHEKKSLLPLISDISDLKQIALYCFDKNFLPEALSIYLLIADKDNTDSGVSQKIGYCRQMLGDSDGALDAYLQADLLQPDNSWTMKRIAQLYRAEKQPEKALQYFLKLQNTATVNISTELNIGHCYLELNDYDKALNAYFKVELSEGGDNPKAWRPIAWTSFLIQRYDLAQKYYAKILAAKPTEHDYLNAGHVELVLNNKKQALTYYCSAVDILRDDLVEFEALFLADKEALISAGIKESFFPILFDEIAYKRN